MSQKFGTAISSELKMLIAEHEHKTKMVIREFYLTFPPRSLEQLLREKNITNIDKAYLAIDWRNKTVFMDKRGNFGGNLFSYAEGERIVDSAINESLD